MTSLRNAIAWLGEDPAPPSDQAAWERFAAESSVRDCFAFALLVVALQLVTFPTDWIVLDAVTRAPMALWRSGVTLIAIASALALWFVVRRDPPRLAFPSACVLFVVAFAFHGFAVARFGGIEHPYLNATLVFVGANLLVQVRFWHRFFLTALLSSSSSVAFFLARPEETAHPLFHSVLIMQLCAVVGFALYGHWTYRLRRANFMQQRALDDARARSESLLLNILPAEVADRLKEGRRAVADHFDEVTVLFADIVGFTPIAQRLRPDQVVAFLNRLFSEFDALADQHGLEKIKTIGDAYMVAGGLPTRRADHAEAVCSMALAMLEVAARTPAPDGSPVHLRVGVATGPVVAGVIGARKFSYDLWGDTVNTASRMESHGLGGTVQVTEETWRRLDGRYSFEERGEIEVKGRGRMRTWLLRPATPPRS
ncbi:MAG: adenylate/guanylate cyclase domain-containing protein [Myxococcota bacterium]